MSNRNKQIAAFAALVALVVFYMAIFILNVTGILSKGGMTLLYMAAFAVTLGVYSFVKKKK